VAKFAWLNATIWAGGFDFTGASNTVTANAEVTALDVTTFGGGGWQENIAGLKNYTVEAGGFWESGAAGQAVDPVAWAQLGQTATTWVVSPANTAGQVCYAMNSMATTYQLGGEIGTAAPFSLNGVASTPYPMVRGQIAAAKGVVSAIGQAGSILTLGAPLAGQNVYAGIQVFSPGTTLTAQLQSAATIGFASPTTRATWPAITTQSGNWLTTAVPGPITDQYWRINVSAITGSFTLGAWIGIA
jgi:hypothetical protein